MFYDKVLIFCSRRKKKLLEIFPGITNIYILQFWASFLDKIIEQKLIRVHVAACGVSVEQRLH